MFNRVTLPQRPTDLPVITPRPGESLISATFRQLDPFHGSGLSATDQTVIVTETCEDLRQALADAGRRNAALLIEQRAHLATIRQLQQALVDANALIASYQDQLEEATANAASDADDVSIMATAWAFHVESH